MDFSSFVCSSTNFLAFSSSFLKSKQRDRFNQKVFRKRRVRVLADIILFYDASIVKLIKAAGINLLLKIEAVRFTK